MSVEVLETGGLAKAEDLIMNESVSERVELVNVSRRKLGRYFYFFEEISVEILSSSKLSLRASAKNDGAEGQSHYEGDP